MKSKLIALIAIFGILIGMNTGISAMESEKIAGIVNIDNFQSDFVNIEVAELPQAVQDAVAKDFAGKAITGAAMKVKDDGSVKYKVSIEGENEDVVYKADGSQAKSHHK